MTSSKSNMLVETLISVFTTDKGTLKVLLIRKKEEPYKGYWILPGNMVGETETIENNMVDAVYDKLGLPTLYIEQHHTFSDVNRYPDNRVIAVSHIGIIDSVTLLLNHEEREEYESNWFPITDLPKLGYDHDIILKKAVEYLSKKMCGTGILKSLFPSDFTLPEIQKTYENVMGKNFDRRNFRKKFVNLGIIEETGDKNEGGTGRPAKLYRFKENINDMNIF